MKFTWSRFGAFMLLGMLAAAVNLGLIVLADGRPLWDWYVYVGGFVIVIGTIAGAIYIISSNLGRGRRRFEVNAHGFRYPVVRTPSPRSSGFAAGFAAFHLVPLIVLYAPLLFE